MHSKWIIFPYILGSIVLELEENDYVNTLLSSINSVLVKLSIMETKKVQKSNITLPLGIKKKILRHEEKKQQQTVLEILV